MNGNTLSFQSNQTQTQVGIAPINPGILDTVRELLGYLAETDQAHGRMREQISGPYPQSSENAAPQSDCLENLLRLACQQAACIAGDAKSILAKL